jgi:hypothetical protein
VAVSCGLPRSSTREATHQSRVDPEPLSDLINEPGVAVNRVAVVVAKAWRVAQDRLSARSRQRDIEEPSIFGKVRFHVRAGPGVPAGVRHERLLQARKYDRVELPTFARVVGRDHDVAMHLRSTRKVAERCRVVSESPKQRFECFHLVWACRVRVQQPEQVEVAGDTA